MKHAVPDMPVLSPLAKLAPFGRLASATVGRLVAGLGVGTTAAAAGMGAGVRAVEAVVEVMGVDAAAGR